MSSQRPVLAPFKKKSISSIFIGIDFGTSYTKVSYSYAPTTNPQIHTLKWNDDFFKPTVLFIKDARLFFDKPDGESKEVKYFKYSMLEESLRNNRPDGTKENFEEMCCVYFLAQLIKRSLQKIQQELHLDDIYTLDIFVNMGVPLENFYEEGNKKNQGLYLDILKNAVTLAGGSKVRAKIPENQVLISNLDEVYSEMLCKKAILNWKANVYPELAAELLLYHESDFVHDGLYAVVDIGGGTVDMALFQKSTITTTKEKIMDCINQDIKPFGIEVRKTKNISENQLMSIFAKLIVDAKKNNKNNQWICPVNFKSIDVFFLGGGANDDWYSKTIKRTPVERNWKQAEIGTDFNKNLNQFIMSDNRLIEKDQRLTISQMLSRHPNEITRVKGFPNFYTSPNYSLMPSSSSLWEDIMYELGKRSGYIL
ncbi:MAG TPA: hypothetical protein DCZ76_08225 [Treponema sp.]|nr:hypothetical protein [Treponema sp.]